MVNKEKLVISKEQESTLEFAEIFNIIQLHQNKACASVNEEHLLMCWEVGEFISSRLKNGRWGDNVLEQLQDFLTRQTPFKRGFGKSNLYNMVKFYDTYSSESFTTLMQRISLPSFFQSPIGKSDESTFFLPENSNTQIKEFFQSPIGKFPKVLTLTTYTNHLDLINRCNSSEEQLFYMFYCHKERLQNKELKRCLKNGTFEALLGGDKKNLNDTLKQVYPDAIHLLKDQILIDFLGIKAKAKEPQLHRAILEHMKNFILELGKDFIFMGSEYPLQVGSETFHVDLLFYHRALQCMVAVELKSEPYHPKDKGQLEFYLEVLDRDVKRSNENPTIGMLLCPNADHTVVEYSLNRSMSPLMVAEYKQALIPKEVVQNALVEYIEYLGKN